MGDITGDDQEKLGNIHAHRPKVTKKKKWRGSKTNEETNCRAVILRSSPAGLVLYGEGNFAKLPLATHASELEKTKEGGRKGN